MGERVTLCRHKVDRRECEACVLTEDLDLARQRIRELEAELQEVGK